MEKHTILGKVVETILSIFKNNWQEFIVKLWTKIPADLKSELLGVVSIVNIIKTFSESTLLDAFVEMTKTDLDNQALEWLRNIIAKYNMEETLVNELQPGHFQTIATELTVAATGLSFGQAAISVENAYQNS